MAISEILRVVLFVHVFTATRATYSGGHYGASLSGTYSGTHNTYGGTSGTGSSSRGNYGSGSSGSGTGTHSNAGHSLKSANTRIYLTGGSNAHEGTIHIEHSGTYGTICDDHFDDEDAQVICRMLGHHGPSTALGSAHFGQGTGTIYLDEVKCLGTEYDVADCIHSTWGTTDCTHVEDAGVICWTVDVMENGRWGTICDRHFTDADADVICSVMGFQNGVAVTGSKFGELSYGRTWTDKLGCRGNETALWQCRYYGSLWEQRTTCNHSMDAGVICDHTSVRLVGGTVPSEGHVEVLHNGVWGSVCGNTFTQNDGDVICRMLGFNHTAVSIQYNKTNGIGPIWLGHLGCQGDEMDMKLCNHGGWNNHSCNHNNDVGLKCRPTDVRLSRGSNPSEGTVEINMDGSWKTICDSEFGDKEADVICRMLGYTGRGAPHTILHTDFFGHTYTPGLDKITCNGDERDINQCSSVYHTTCPSSNTVGLRCEGVYVRLVAGAHSTEGRVEVLHGGEWGSVCDGGWDDNDATVICKMLSYYPYDRTVAGKAVSGSYFGYGDGPVWLADVGCNGNESDITECSINWNGGVNCDHGRDAGVICQFEPAVRLQGGHINSEGRIELYYGSAWRSFCDDGWDKSDAVVFCRELGFWTADPILYNSSHFGSVNTQLYKMDPQCSGSEGAVEMCPMGTKLAPASCSSSHNIGVDCNPQNTGRTDFRLVDGTGPWSGRLEIKSGGTWGSVCYDSWNDTYTDMVCQTLRFLGTKTSKSFKTPKGLTSMNFKSFHCDPGVTNPGHCKIDFNITECSASNSEAVGIDCSDGIGVTLSNIGEVRGEVQFYSSNRTSPWSVCRSGLNDAAAGVICAMMGYPNTSPNVTSVSSRLPILYTNIACDGWENHVAQCSTINTGQPCADRAYIDCLNGCVRTTTGSTGIVLSDSYPMYTMDTDCLDIIQNTGMTVMKLTFNDLDLSADGDFIEVRDGAHGRQLGFFASNNAVPLLATSKDFYIRMKTNSMGNARGFNVSYSPLEVVDTVSMQCGPSGWHVEVNLTLLRHLHPDTGVSQIKLSDQHCTGRVMGDLVVFDQHYADCSTTHKVNDDNVVYYNQLVYPESSDPFPVIVRGYRWTLDLECDVARTDTLANKFHPNRTVVHHHPHITNSAHYNSQVKLFSDATFYQEIHGNPVSVNTGEDVFVMVKMNSDDVNIKMRIDTCYAKADPNAGPTLTYPLIKDGCVVDSYTRLLSQGNHETRFVFSAFEFPQSRDSVYVFCNTTYCDVTDHADKCTQVCHGAPSIIGRDLDSW